MGLLRDTGAQLHRIIDLVPHGTADETEATRGYEAAAPTYDMASVAGQALRTRALAGLAARPGETVLDVGCGTGLNLPPLGRAVGPYGRVVGVELSAAMLDAARGRVSAAGMSHVELVHAPARDARLPRVVDAVLLCMVHDVMRSPSTLEHVLRPLRRGGRVIACGSKWAPWWALSVNLSAWYYNRPFVTTFEGFDAPWSHLSDLLPGLRVEALDAYFGGAYLAWGTR